jgi:hypothetical protein
MAPNTFFFLKRPMYRRRALSHLNAWDDIHRLNGINGKDRPFSYLASCNILMTI